MVYEVRCILPYDRTMMIIKKSVISSTCLMMDKEPFIPKNTIVVQSPDGVLRTVSFDELGEKFSFEYIERLIFFHEKDLRDSLFLVDSEAECSKENMKYFQEDDRLKYKLENGQCHPHISIVYVNEHVGYGLFATDAIASGTFIGEYVGVVKRVSSCENKGPASAYSANYGTDGSTEICAYEYGNVIRFVNHSDSPNCTFRKVTIDDMQHVLVMTEEDVSAGEQLSVSYGLSYWQAHATPAVDINSTIS
jgi:hypothetical protein